MNKISNSKFLFETDLQMCIPMPVVLTLVFIRKTPVSNSVGLGWGLIIFISSKFSDDAEASGPGPKLSLAKK